MSNVPNIRARRLRRLGQKIAVTHSDSQTRLEVHTGTSPYQLLHQKLAQKLGELDPAGLEYALRIGGHVTELLILDQFDSDSELFQALGEELDDVVSQALHLDDDDNDTTGEPAGPDDPPSDEPGEPQRPE